MKYKAKIDWWIGLAILAGLIVPAAAALSSMIPWQIGLAAVVWVLVFGFLFPQSYETTPDALLIRAGLTRRTIPYAAITAVRPSMDTRSSMAMSLDRVEVESAAGKWLISPVDQDAFMADLEARAPQLTRRGQELVIPIG